MDDDKASEGVEHLQAAAREMISAARAFLDAVEEMVEDQDAVSSVVGAVGRAAQGAARAARQAREDLTGRVDPDDGEGGVEHISVS